MKRNVTITLEKAQEWYNSGNDSLKEIALQAFNENELKFDFRNIKSLSDACSVLGLNYNEILDIVEYVKENNIDKVSFLGLIPHGRADLNKDIIFLDKDINNNHKLMILS